MAVYRSGSPGGATMEAPMVVVALLCVLPAAEGWRLARPWTNQTWCPSVVEPVWPFAYAKFGEQAWERKGRSNPDEQDVRHECATHGVESKCHRCERIACGAKLDGFCEYELQGVDAAAMSGNVPTASDAPCSTRRSSTTSTASSAPRRRSPARATS